ncbi:MAG: hypothetical protein IID58_04605 [Proteobacteria bacterium]|nr:hypothetical protein [Pseudomonadota bacterium]
MQRINLLLASLLLLPAAAAQDEVIEEVPEIRRYTVEIIVFAYVEDVSVGTEIFPADIPLSVDADALDDNAEDILEDDALEEDEPEPVVDDEAAEEVDPEAARLLTVLMTEDEFTLQNVIEKFDELDVYETIMHVGWTQATIPLEATEAIDIEFFGAPPPGLAGSFSLYLSRYLHLIVDLALDAPGDDDDEPALADLPAFSFGDFRLRYDDAEPLPAEFVRYRILENRIIKNGDIRYFDHPKFGVVAKITRYEEEEDEEGLEEEDEEDLQHDSEQLLSWNQ